MIQKTYRCAPRCRSLPPALVRWYVWLAQEAEERHCKIKTLVSGFRETAEIREQVRKLLAIAARPILPEPRPTS
jgi:hypothetical protein